MILAHLLRPVLALVSVTVPAHLATPPASVISGVQPQGPAVHAVTPDGYPVTYGQEDVPGLPAPVEMCVPADAAVFVWCTNYSGT